MTQPKLRFAHAALQRIAFVALAAGLTTCATAQTMPAATPAAASTAAAPTQTPPMNGIAHIAIRVQSIADSLAFYNKLGYQQAFAWTRGDVTTQSFLKLNETQYIELYPAGPAGPPRTPAPGSAPGTAPAAAQPPARPPTPSTSAFMHLCFEGADLHALHDFYVAEGLTPSPVNTAAAGNLLFTMRGPQQATSAQNIEYTQYMPGSKHTLDFGQHLSPDRVADKMTVVVLAMQDPAAARDYYLTKLGFTASKGNPMLLTLPGKTGQQVEIVPAAELGTNGSIVLTTPNLDKSAAQLTRQQVAFKRASSATTDANGRTRSVEMISVTDPDGNILRIMQAN
ncbi:MAG TPA: VOC family protein [Acidobacteriaceae bacterium]|nr:VOC family protein [Acidobacteriaceae bacterium]